MAKDLDNLPQARGKSLPVEMPIGKARDKRTSGQKRFGEAYQAGEEREKSKNACFPLATKNYTRDSPRGSPWVVPQGHLGAARQSPGVPLESPGGSCQVQPQGSQGQSPGAARSSII